MAFLDDIPDIIGQPRRRVKAIRRVAVVAAVPPPSEDGLPCVVWHVLRCPHCGSKRNNIYAMRPPVRYHKCADCTKTFKSIEKEG